MSHSYKWLVYKGNKVRIDREIASLISNLWELGIGTTNSCQASCSYKCDHKWKIFKYKDGSELFKKIKSRYCHDQVWICFDGARSYEKFLNVVAVYEDKPGGMYEHIQGHTIKSHPHNVWTVTTYIENTGIILREERQPVVKSDNLPKHRKTVGVYVEDGCKKNNFKIMPQLHFPRKHISYVEQKLKEALQ